MQLFDSKDWLKVDWAKAVELWGKVLIQSPDAIEALHWRGAAYLETGRIGLAMADLQRATTLAPLNHMAWGFLCRARIFAEQPAEARPACEKAVSLNDANIPWALYLGHTWLLQGQKAEAWLWYEKALPAIDDEATLQLALNDFDRFVQQGRQAQLAEEARRWFEAKSGEWLARKAQADQLQKDAEVAEEAKDWEKAIALQEQRIPLLETLHGATHPKASAANILGPLYKQAGRGTEAEALHRKRISKLENTLGPDHIHLANSLEDFGDFLADEAAPRYAMVESLYKRAIAMYEKALGPEHPKVRSILYTLAKIHILTRHQAEAEALFKRCLAMMENAHGLEDLKVAKIVRHFAALYYLSGRFAEAVPLYMRELAIKEKYYGPDHPEVVEPLKQLALSYWWQFRPDEAEAPYRRLLAIYEKRDTDDVDVLYDILEVHAKLERKTETQSIYRRILALEEKARGPEDPRVARILGKLSVLDHEQGNRAEAEAQLKRAAAILKKLPDSYSGNMLIGLGEIAEIFSDWDRHAEAAPLYERRLQLWEKHFDAANNQEEKWKRSQWLELVIFDLANCYKSQGRLAEAEMLHRRGIALSIGNLALAEGDEISHKESLRNIGNGYYRAGRYAEGVPYSRRVYSIFRQRFTQAGDTPRGELAEEALLTEQKSMWTQSDVLEHIYMLSKSGAADAAAESFEAAQLAQASSVGQSVARMAARFAATGGELAQAIRQRQDAADQLARIDNALTKAAAKPPAQRNADDEARMRSTLASLEQTLLKQTRAIARRFPKYDALVSPVPVAVAEAQKLLRKDEALLFYLNPGTMEKGYASKEKQGFVWLVRPHVVSFLPLDISSYDLNKQVGTLRGKLDPEQNPNVAPFDAAASHALYRQIFAPLEDKLKGVRHIVLVSDGALQSLPFSVLVDKAPVPSGQTSWLADRYAFSVVPSVSSLRALRVFSRAKTGKEPFTGFGNPMLQGSPNQSRRVAARALFARGITTGDGVLKNGIADVEQIRKAAPLPETETELRAVAGALKAGPGSVRVGIDATETLVKQTDLTPYRVLAFSTHGVMAGELAGVAEPGLILTPPAEGTALDDGYLTASEVAQLKLNADWVILSACNTAAPDGKPGAEGLSGLAKGFFYAGARSLLVSNWYVDSNAATRLTTEMFKRYVANPGRGKAEALSQAMQKLRQHPDFAHTLFWAPFSVVGEGG